jgi:aspartyl-tRNA(Asn)/glutamyl-tRNA(Gln) amidotransferase subunit B
MGNSEADSWFLVEHSEKARYFDKCVDLCKGDRQLSKTVLSLLIGNLTARLYKASVAIEASPVSPEDLCRIAGMIEEGIISYDSSKRIFDAIFASGGSPDDIVKKLSLAQINDEAELKKLVEGVLEDNPKSVADYKNGKDSVLGFIVGQCMKASKGKGNPQIINKMLREILNAGKDI